jgi:phosphoribosylaminoimidazole-succinocarboxamide synthase
MAQIPAEVLKKSFVLEGETPENVGKVRDSYALADPDKMLVLVTNRASTFDFVLNTTVEKKGEVLNATSHFWVTQVIKSECKTDFIAAGSDIDKYIPSRFRNNPELQKIATVVKRVKPPELEDIVRFVLTGSGLASYKETGMVCGHKLPLGLHDGSLLPFPIYTPTTKAKEGHDEHVTAESVRKIYGDQREKLAIKVANMLHRYAEKTGILLADTKFEFGLDEEGNLVLADEKGTMDSSRFVDLDLWFEYGRLKKFPPSMDKQFLREWAKIVGIDKLDPKKPEDVLKVHSIPVPAEVIQKTTEIYLEAFKRLTGMKLEHYQSEIMGIKM